MVMAYEMAGQLRSISERVVAGDWRYAKGISLNFLLARRTLLPNVKAPVAG